MGHKEFDHCGGSVWSRRGRVKLIRNWPTNCGHTRYVLLRENILIDTCKHEAQTTAKGEERVTRLAIYPHGRRKTPGKRLLVSWYTCRSGPRPGTLWCYPTMWSHCMQCCYFWGQSHGTPVIDIGPVINS